VKKEYDQSAIPQTLLGSLHQTSMIVSIQSQIECLLEEMRIKLSIVVSDLLGSSGLRILHALANGETDAKSLALLGDDRLKCTEEQLVEALTGRSHPMQGQMLALQLERLRLLGKRPKFPFWPTGSV
jgi:hypothetical protein